MARKWWMLAAVCTGVFMLIGAGATGAASFVLVRERDFVTVTDLEAEPVAAVA